jgi:hypothetical protein
MPGLSPPLVKMPTFVTLSISKPLPRSAQRAAAVVGSSPPKTHPPFAGAGILKEV